jgi:hypothetical protein
MVRVGIENKKDKVVVLKEEDAIRLFMLWEKVFDEICITSINGPSQIAQDFNRLLYDMFFDHYGLV